MEQYDIQKFLKLISDLDLPLMLQEATLEADSLERSIRRVEKQHQYKAEEFLRILKGFIFLLRNGIKPNGVSDGEFILFRPVIEKLVDKGQLKPTILKLFG